MKRKNARKSSSKKEDEGSNGVDAKSEQNGDTSDYDEEEVPNKKRKSSKSSRKSVSFSAKKVDTAEDSEDSADQESGEEPKEEKKSSKSSRKSVKKEEVESQDSDQNDDNEVQEKKKDKKRSNKKGKNAQKEEPAPKEDPEESEDNDEDDETQYEVEAVLDEKMIKGVKHYLIRWKGYEEESDTWEPEDTLDCSRLIEEFKEKKKKKTKSPKPIKKEKRDSKSSKNWDENEDFEVERILEVHHRKDGKREFLVSWKGYGSADNSWEPEENMDCKDLIAKFMAKVERAKSVEEKVLRVNRQHVQRYTLYTPDSGRRLSKRFRGKERVQYHDAE